MIIRLRSAITALRRDETGGSLPEALIAVLITSLLLGVIASASFAASGFQTELAEQGKSNNDRSYTEAMWRTNAQLSTAIRVTGNKQVVFAGIGTGGICRESTWETVTAGGLTSLTLTVSAFGETMTPAGCSGTSKVGPVETLIDAVAVNTAFTYRNKGGRNMTFVDGAPVFGPGTQPATVSDIQWRSTAVGTAILTTVTDLNDDVPNPLLISQITAQISPLTGSPSAPTTFNAP